MIEDDADGLRRELSSVQQLYAHASLDMKVAEARGDKSGAEGLFDLCARLKLRERELQSELARWGQTSPATND